MVFCLTLEREYGFLLTFTRVAGFIAQVFLIFMRLTCIKGFIIQI